MSSNGMLSGLTTKSFILCDNHKLSTAGSDLKTNTKVQPTSYIPQFNNNWRALPLASVTLRETTSVFTGGGYKEKKNRAKTKKLSERTQSFLQIWDVSHSLTRWTLSCTSHIRSPRCRHMVVRNNVEDALRDLLPLLLLLFPSPFPLLQTCSLSDSSRRIGSARHIIYSLCEPSTYGHGGSDVNKHKQMCSVKVCFLSLVYNIFIYAQDSHVCVKKTPDETRIALFVPDLLLFIIIVLYICFCTYYVFAIYRQKLYTIYFQKNTIYYIYIYRQTHTCISLSLFHALKK